MIDSPEEYLRRERQIREQQERLEKERREREEQDKRDREYLEELRRRAEIEENMRNNYRH